ncbi:hypothetical protein BBO_00096 [Beauveria brongniartii RCEF 3172]|uniref:Uncharacterized protein n=1 Tax=Beauveria brongniartii RCEF 3172 TaxID=1081107 RepID=A0A162I4M5_9HYPO|nr:hypothetical protein BBO_00096 [Beauveria brongniartii RCEF 3172]
MQQGCRDIQHMLQADSDAESNPECDSVEEFGQLLGHSRSIGIEEIKYSLPSKPLTDRVIRCYFSVKFHAVPLYPRTPVPAAVRGVLGGSRVDGAPLNQPAVLNPRRRRAPGQAQARQRAPRACWRRSRSAAFYLGVSTRCLVTGRYLEEPARLRRGGAAACALAQHAAAGRGPRALGAVRACRARMAQLQRVPPRPEPAARALALHAGLPPIIHESLTDTEPPRQPTRRGLLTKDTAVLPPARPSARPRTRRPSSPTLPKSTLSVILRRVMLPARARRAATALPRDAAAQRPAAGVARRAGPAACASGPSAAPPSPTANYTIMHRIMLELMYRQGASACCTTPT